LAQAVDLEWIDGNPLKGRSISRVKRDRKRIIPVHPKLLRLGFVDYWRTVSSLGAGPLWPDLVRTTLNGAGGKISQWFGAFKNSKGFGDSLVFHSFRHTLET